MVAEDGIDIFDVLMAAAEYVAGAIEAFVEGIAPLIELAGKVLTAFSKACYSVYEAAGAPYGPDRDGMFRWIEEYLQTGRLGWEDS